MQENRPHIIWTQGLSRSAGYSQDHYFPGHTDAVNVHYNLRLQKELTTSLYWAPPFRHE